MNSLYVRLSLALLLIMIAVGSGFYLLEDWSTRRFHEEVTQRLNGSIAMYVTDQTLLIEDGVVNSSELTRLAERAMVINPSAEVYLLDVQGAILGHAFPPESVILTEVDPGPVRLLTEGVADFPIYGTDPRNPRRSKVFSAAPVIDDGVLQGYLYVILGGYQYDQLAGAVRSSHSRRTSIFATAALVLGGFLAGLAVFALLTRRLAGLTRAVENFSGVYGEGEPDHKESIALLARGLAGGQDEIGKLSRAFAAMAGKIRQQFEALQENDRLRRELIGNVSHDLRTPLTILHGYVDTLMLKNHELGATEREHYLQITRKHTARLGDLIDQLFELSKLEAGSMPLSLETFSLSELLQDVVQGFQLEARRLGLELHLNHAAPRSTVRADIALVQRVLENLIRNALDYTPAGGRISLEIAASPGDVAVIVSDTGYGIPESQLGSIFDRYFRSDNVQAPNELSSGLGLAIVKRILDLHGSRITVSSVIDEGTRFEFWLPAADAA